MKTDFSGKDRKSESESLSTIPVAVIQTLVENYRSQQLACINENLLMDDAHSIWFDLETLKKFITEIEEQAQILDPEVTDKDLGIRFYYAAYPETPEEPVPAEYGRRHTLIMIPTKKHEELNYDFNPFGEEEALAITVGRPTLALAQNHGCLVPPDNSVVESY